MSQTQRRGHGEGSVFYDASRERWIVLIDLGRNATGKRQRVSRSARTKTAANALLRSLQASLEAGEDPRGVRRTVQSAVDDFKVNGLAHDLAPSSAYKTKHYADAFADALGEVRLRDLSVRLVEQWLADLAAAGKAQDTITVARRSATQCLDHAIRLGWLPLERNAARRARLPQGKASAAHKVLTEDLVARLVKASEKEWWHALLATVAVTGMRIGEASALAWSSVDLDEGTLAITRASRLNPDGSLTFAEPKASSGRQLAIPPELVALLRAHRKTMAERFMARGKPLPDLAFPTTAGTAPDPTDLRRWLRRMATKAKVKIAGFHALRHAVASSLADQGLPPIHVAAQLGHATPRTTMAVYTHALAPVATAAVERGGRLLRAVDG